MELISFESFVLKVTPYLEKDLIVTLLTRDSTRIDAYARSAKVSKKRFNGSLDLFNLVQGLIKPRGEDQLAELVECQVVSGFQEILRGNIQGYALFSYAAEFVTEFLKASQSIAGLFDCLHSALLRMSEQQADFLLVDLQSRLIQLFGYWPHWDECNRCHLKTDYKSQYFFKPGEGMLICGSCLNKNQYNRHEFTAISPDLLLSLMNSEDQNSLSLKKKRLLLENLIHHVLGKRLKSHDFLCQMFYT